MKPSKSDPKTGRRPGKNDVPAKAAPRAKKAKKTLSDAEAAAFGPQLDSIRQWLKKVRFRKSLFGVDEADVWKKISELNSLYETALIAERGRYDALLKERVEQAARTLAEQYAPAPAPESPDGTENVSEEAE